MPFLCNLSPWMSRPAARRILVPPVLVPTVLALAVVPLLGAGRDAAEGPARAAPAMVGAAGLQGSLDASELELLDQMLRTSPYAWADSMPAARELFVRKPAETLHHLVDQLEVEEVVHGLRSESQIHSVCGNALGLLEGLSEVRVDHQAKDWIGFSTHDHRGAKPSVVAIRNPWECWLEVREDLPPEEWFWGLSAGELQTVQALLHTEQGQWEPAQLEAVQHLGWRADPLLLELLLEEDHACADLRLCDQAVLILEALHEVSVGRLSRHELLRFDPADPMRAQRLALEKNRASMQLLQQRWLTKLVSRQAQE